jgi:hypothetical protein
MRARRLAMLAVVAALAVFAISKIPPRVDGTGSLNGCSIDRGWPVVHLDAGAERYLPVVDWPPGLSYDLSRSSVVDPSGRVILNSGDRITVKGSIVDVHGDPSPCYFTRGIEIESIVAG